MPVAAGHNPEDKVHAQPEYVDIWNMIILHTHNGFIQVETYRDVIPTRVNSHKCPTKWSEKPPTKEGKI